MRRARSENENNYKTNHTCNAAHGNAFHIIIALFGQNTLPVRGTESGKKSGHLFLTKQKTDNKNMLKYATLQDQQFKINSHQVRFRI